MRRAWWRRGLGGATLGEKEEGGWGWGGGVGCSVLCSVWCKGRERACSSVQPAQRVSGDKEGGEGEDVCDAEYLLTA